MNLRICPQLRQVEIRTHPRILTVVVTPGRIEVLQPLHIQCLESGCRPILCLVPKRHICRAAASTICLGLPLGANKMRCRSSRAFIAAFLRPARMEFERLELRFPAKSIPESCHPREDVISYFTNVSVSINDNQFSTLIIPQSQRSSLRMIRFQSGTYRFFIVISPSLQLCGGT